MNTTTLPPALKLTLALVKSFDNDKRVKAVRKALIRAAHNAVEVRAKVDAYIAPVFAKFEFFNDLEARMGDVPRVRITDPSKLYLSEDKEQCARFYAACDAAHKANGYDLESGFCPALIAEHEIVRLENALLHLADSLLNTPFSKSWGDNRDKALELLTKGVAK